jgi:hypothetical protein
MTRKHRNSPQSAIAKFIGGRALPVLLLLNVILSSGCHREQITVYRVPKESSISSAMSTEPTRADEGPAMPQLQWKTTPPGWQQKQPTGMSVLSFAITSDGGHKGEMSVLTFPSEGVGPISIVNIVRQNAGLPPITEEEFSRMIEAVPIGDGKGSLMDFSGATASETNAPSNSIMLGLLVHGGASWFFKLAGDRELVAAQKPAMLDFLKSVSFVNGDGAMSPHGHAMASTNDKHERGAATPPVITPEAPRANHPAWEVPAGWKEVPPSQMLLAKFVITGAEGAAEATVSQFGGTAGGALANVNRWRKQVGLAPIAQEELDKTAASVDVMGGKAMLIDVNGKAADSGKDTRIIGVICPRAGETWFYKLTGDPATAEREKNAFLKFVQSVRYPNG